jgi:hypothetical protein
MHIAVLLIVGPLGMQHKPAVLIWNAFFIVQNLLLFVRLQPADVAPNVEQNPIRSTNRLATLTVAIAILAPLLEPLGLCDHWLAWGLYAPRASRVSLFFSDAAAMALPEDLLAHLEPDNDSDWRQLYLDRWSLAARDVPVYPQARVQLAIAIAVVQDQSLDRNFQIIRVGPANRWSGAREHDTLRTLTEMEIAANEYFLNARPSKH